MYPHPAGPVFPEWTAAGYALSPAPLCARVRAPTPAQIFARTYASSDLLLFLFQFPHHAPMHHIDRIGREGWAAAQNIDPAAAAAAAAAAE